MWPVATAFVILLALVWYWRIDTFLLAIVSLADLLFSIKRRAKHVQTKIKE